MFEQTRLFLYRVLPWAPLGDPSAYVNVHWTFQGAGYARPAWSGRACISIDECVRTIQWAQKQPDTKDFYVCMSTQRECETRVSKRGNEMRIAHREQANVVQLRALWLDVDVKDGHHKDGYGGLGEALVAVKKFIDDSGLPTPTMYVTTGSGGLHLYWTLDTAISKELWQPLAQALAEATRRFSLKCDTGVTVDSARVMRVPETKHSKHGKLAQLSLKHMLQYDYTLDQMRHALSPYMGAQVIPLNPRGNVVPGINSDLAGGIETPKAAPINLRSVADAGCGFIREALDTGGASYANPLWNLTTLTACFSEGGRADAHAMASGHASYSPQETDELFDRKTREQAEKNLGWPSCQSVENAGCSHCQTCPLKGPGTKPLQFGRPTQASLAAALQAPQEPDLPHGYSRNPKGYIQHVKHDKEGNTSLVMVAPYEISGAWLQQSPWTLNFNVRMGHGPTLTQIEVPISDLNSADRFARKLGDQGMGLKKHEVSELKDFLVSWQQKLKDIKDAIVSSQPFGWVTAPNGSIEGFAYGGRVWGKGDDKPSANPDPTLAYNYTPKGELEPWKNAAQMVTDLHTSCRDAFIAAAFGGPLARFAGQPGLMIAGYSVGSGKGKSASLLIGQAVWGAPRAHNGQTDTKMSVMGKLGKLSNIPLFWDEVKGQDQEQRFVSMVFEVAGGRERSRMNSDTSLRSSGSWDTILVSANNDSIVELMTRGQKTTNAGIYRLFEFQVPPFEKTVFSSAMADQMIKRLDGNYGRAGLVYAKFLGEHHERVHNEVVRFRERIEKEFSIQNEERYWACSMACLFMGAMYANQLKLTDIDLPAFYKFLGDTLTHMRSEVGASPVDMTSPLNVANVFGAYLADQRARHTLITDRLWTQRGRPAGNPIKSLIDPSKLEEIRVHYGKDDGTMRINAGHFKDWLARNLYSPNTIINEMKRQFGMTAVNSILAAGTEWRATMPIWLFHIDLHHPSLKHLTDD